MNWMEYTVLTTTEASDLVSQILMDAGSTGTMIEDRNDVAANQRPEGSSMCSWCPWPSARRS